MTIWGINDIKDARNLSNKWNDKIKKFVELLHQNFRLRHKTVMNGNMREGLVSTSGVISAAAINDDGDGDDDVQAFSYSVGLLTGSVKEQRASAPQIWWAACCS